MVAKSCADDIIITIIIDEKVTDGSYFNLVFWDGNKWITPDAPLLNGVRRQQLLAANKIKEAPISIADLSAFEKVSLINAMLSIGTIELSMEQVLERQPNSKCGKDLFKIIGENQLRSVGEL
ncbi:MAG: aminotransferase class IV [Bacteroidota bacterium]